MTSTVAGSAAPAGATAAGAVSGSEQLPFQIWLKPDLSGATAFANAVSTPGSPSYHQYLSPSAYTARFGATASEASQVESWLSSAGFSNVQASGQRDYVSATGSVAAINQAFGVQMTRYQATGADGKPVTFQSNNTDVSVPSSIGDAVASVTGLNTAPATADTASAGAPPTQSSSTTYACSHFWAQNFATISPSFHGATQLPTNVCGYTAAQLRAVYGLDFLNTGAGETIALIEDGTPTAGFQTLSDYAAQNKLTPPTSTQFATESIGQGNACGNPFGPDGTGNDEEELDSEAAFAMAPSADQLIVGGDSCDSDTFQALFDADTVVLGGNGSNPQANIVSNSWEFSSETTSGDDPITAHLINVRAVAEGVGMYYSAGDFPGVEGPSSDPFSTAVGGTSLGIGAQNNRVFETGWSIRDSIGGMTPRLNSGIGGGTGGGRSQLYGQPSYQAGVVPASMAKDPQTGTLDRTVPDIAADASAATGFQEGDLQTIPPATTPSYTTFAAGGTSLSAPLVAAIVADAQQGQSTAFGFINPLLYSLAGTTALNDVLPEPSSTTPLDDKAAASPLPNLVEVFDAQGKGTQQVTAPGYDTMTGLGTPNGNAFIAALQSGQ